MRKLLATLSVFLALPALSASAQSRIERVCWTHPTPPAAASFVLAWGTSAGSHPTVVPAGKPTPNSSGAYCFDLSVPTTANAYVVARAIDAAGNASADSNERAWLAQPPPPPPPPPPPGTDTTPPAKPIYKLAEFTQTQTSLTYSWQAGTDNVGVHHYNVFRGSSAALAAQVKIGETTGLTYTHTGLACATDYSIALTVQDSAGNQSTLAEAIYFPARTLACGPPPPPPPPPTDTTAPTAPTSVRAKATTQTAITVGWNASTDAVGVTGYRVYRAGALIGSPTALGWVDPALACGTAYSYAVEARDLAGNTSARATASLSTAACSPPSPTGLTPPTALMLGAREIMACWKPGTGHATQRLDLTDAKGTAFAVSGISATATSVKTLLPASSQPPYTATVTGIASDGRIAKGPAATVHGPDVGRARRREGRTTR